MAGSYDVVVIGSGFGGAVTAARLAEAGRSVCLLERGRRWEAGEYPRTISEAEGGVWDEKAHYGFLEYRVFRRMDVIQGCGVGGGSLHYFNVHLRTPPSIFDRPEWPEPLSRPVLDPYYDRVGEVMEARPLEPPAGMRMPARTVAFLEAARRAGYDPDLVPIAVHTGAARNHPVSGMVQEPCAFTADCLLGCRPRSKNSLDVTYLPLGERSGLEIRPLHVAERIEAASGGGWAASGRRLDPDHPGRSEPFRVEGKALILAAGTLGTNELLLRARDLHRTLPRLPASVGRRYSPNGDMLFAGTLDADRPVDPSNGPSITAGTLVRGRSGNLVHVQDLGFPPAFTSFADGAIPVRKRLVSVGRGAVGYLRASRGGPPFRAALLLSGSFVPRLLPYLGMGTDAANGVFGLDRQGRLSLDWDPSASMEMFREMEGVMKGLSRALGGEFLRSPPWHPPFRRLLTAHPLGGCVMSASPATGVTDHRGEVWDHPGLFVADGAVIPGPLAVNPSLTIAAVAERTAQWIVHGRELG